MTRFAGREMLVIVGVLVLFASSAKAQAPRPLTRGQQITQEANAKAALRAQIKREVKAQQDQALYDRTYGVQNYYRGPKGDVINSRDLPPGSHYRDQGYHFVGSRDGGRPQPWQRGYKGR